MILTTRLTGVVTTEDVQRWRESLARDAAGIPDGGTFKLLLDLRVQNYEERLGRAEQRFFTDVEAARAWLKGV